MSPIRIFSDLHVDYSVYPYLVAQSCLTLCNPWTVACQAPLSGTPARPPGLLQGRGRPRGGLTADGVEGGPRPLLEALPEPQAVLLAVQQRVGRPVHGPTRASRPPGSPPGAAPARAAGAGVRGSRAPGRALGGARGAEPAPTRAGQKRARANASGRGTTLRRPDGGTSGAEEGLPGPQRK